MFTAFALLCSLAFFLCIASLTITVADVPKDAVPPNARFLRPLIRLVGFGGNALLGELLHVMFCNNGSVIDTVRDITERRFTYQQMNFLWLIPMIHAALAVAIGFALRSSLRTKYFSEEPYRPASEHRRKRRVLLLDGVCLGLWLVAAMSFALGGVNRIRINEICPRGVMGDEAFVELRNDGRFPCELGGLYLSDRADDPLRFRLPEDTIPPGGLYSVTLDENAPDVGRSAGDTVLLSDSGGTVDTVTLQGSRAGGLSYCWSSIDRLWRYMTPSLGKVNLDVALKAPRFSVPAGYYADEFTLTLSSDPDTEIHYTTDGSAPTADSPLYTEPIRVYDRSGEANRWRAVRHIVYDWKNAAFDDTPIPKAFVVRAMATDQNGRVSAPATATYLVGSDLRYDRAVVSITADENDLFGEDGIYVTGTTYDNWYLAGGSGDRPTANFDTRGLEIPASLELFMDGRTLYLAQNVGFRVQGGSTRWLPLKRFSVFARKGYGGRATFDKTLFEGKGTHSFGLRDGFCNAFSMVTVPDRDVAAVQSIPATLFLNGEFWYDTYVQEKYNDTFFRQTYGVRDVEFLKTGITEDIRAFLAKHDLSDQSDYDRFNQFVDIQSYIDYICINVYLGNTDYSEYGNVAMWRTPTKENDSFGDGRWRWCLYDMDLQTAGCRANYGLTDITDAQLDTFNIVCDWDPPVNERTIYVALKANDTFRKQFVLSFMDIMNTDFAEPRMAALLEEWGEDISYDDYFFRERGKYMAGFLAKEFGLKGSLETVTVSVNDEAAGYVTVNTARPALSDGTWSGQYFTDYPVTVTAHANPGYVFRGWQGSADSADESIELSVKGGIALHAMFDKE